MDAEMDAKVGERVDLFGPSVEFLTPTSERRGALHGDKISRRTSMDTQPITTVEIEAIVSSTRAAALHANDNRPERLPTRQIPGRGITRWLVDAALRGLIAGALYGGMRPDPTAFDRD
jgi:hypothetical protein